MRAPGIGRLLGGALLVAGLAIGGCDRQDGADGVATAGGAGQQPAGTTSPGERGRQFAQCMRDNGIDVPDPDPDTGQPGFAAGRGQAAQPGFRAAIEKCRDLLPAGGVRPTLDPAQIEGLRQFAACMREHGVDLPDPDPNAPDFGFGAARGLDRTSPTFRAAFEACRSKRPDLLTRSPR